MSQNNVETSFQLLCVVKILKYIYIIQICLKHIMMEVLWLHLALYCWQSGSTKLKTENKFCV